ncbi:MAG: hypothetical protein WC342_00320 [Methanoregula sp.]
MTFSNTVSTIVPARLQCHDKKHLRETIIRITLKEIAEGVSVVQQHLPATGEEFRNPDRKYQ